MKKYNNLGFTLIELLVAIAIIAIITLGATNINFNKLNDNQRIDIFTNNIVSNYELIRNNSLIGKGVGKDLRVPSSWKIDFSFSSSGAFDVSYMSGGLYTPYNDYSISFGDNYSLKSLVCTDLGSNTNNLSSSEVASIIISGQSLSLSGSCDSNDKNLEVELDYKGITKKLKINTVNGLVERG